jgi:hypothetical protein
VSSKVTVRKQLYSLRGIGRLVDVLTRVERLYEAVQQVLLEGIVVLIVCAMEVSRGGQQRWS